MNYKTVLMRDNEKLQRLSYFIFTHKILVLFDDSDPEISNIKKNFEETIFRRNLVSRYIIYGHEDRDYEFMISLYNMYEFTNQMRVVSNSVQYGTMLNYLRTGIITEEEYLETFLL